MDSAGCVSQIDRQPCRPCKGARTGVPAVDRRKNLAVFHTRTPGSFCIRVYHRLSAAQSEILSTVTPHLPCPSDLGSFCKAPIPVPQVRSVKTSAQSLRAARLATPRRRLPPPGSFCIRIHHRLSAAQSEIPPQPSRRACRIRPTRVRFVKRRFLVCALSSFCKDGNAESSRFASPRPRPDFPRPVRFVIPRHRPSAKHPLQAYPSQGSVEDGQLLVNPKHPLQAYPSQSSVEDGQLLVNPKHPAPGLSQPKLRRRRMTSGPH